MCSRNLLCFIHIPKNSGTYVIKCINENKIDLNDPKYQTFLQPNVWNENSIDLKNLPLEVKFVSGHIHYYNFFHKNHNVDFIISFRDPVSRFISNFHWLKYSMPPTHGIHKIELDEFVENFQHHKLATSNEQTIYMIDSMDDKIRLILKKGYSDLNLDERDYIYDKIDKSFNNFRYKLNSEHVRRDMIKNQLGMAHPNIKINKGSYDKSSLSYEKFRGKINEFNWADNYLWSSFHDI